MTRALSQRSGRHGRGKLRQTETDFSKSIRSAALLLPSQTAYGKGHEPFKERTDECYRNGLRGWVQQFKPFCRSICQAFRDKTF